MKDGLSLLLIALTTSAFQGGSLGKGLATEAALAVRNRGWELGFKRLISIIDPENIRSIRVAQKVGMQYEKDAVFKEIPVRIYTLNKN